MHFRCKDIFAAIIFLSFTIAGVSRQYHFTNYTVEDGLGQSQVLALSQDGRGNIWMGTWGAGISIFDGTRFTSLTTDDGLKSNFIRYLYRDRQDNMWFAMPEHGVGRYDGKNLFFLDQTNDSLFKEIFCIFQSKNNDLWFGTRHGAFRWNGKKLKRFDKSCGLPHETVSHISQSRMGELLMATPAGAAKMINGKASLIAPEIFDYGPGAEKVNRIIEARDGSIWMGTRAGLFRYNRNGVTRFTTKDGLTNDFIRSVFQDRSGDIWVATNRGACMYDGDKFRPYTVNEGLCKDKLFTMMPDMQGNIWFGTNGGGVCKYSGELFLHFSEREGLHNSIVWSITKDEKDVFWLGTNEGLALFDGDQFYRPKGLEEINERILRLYTDSSGRVWVAGIKGLYVFKDYQLERKYDQVKDGNTGLVYSVLETKSGKFWVSAEFGLFTLEGDKWTRMEGDLTKMNFLVRAMHEDENGVLWGGTDGSGLMAFKDGKARFWGEKEGLVFNKITSLTPGKDGTLWLGTNEGISRFDGNSFCSITKHDGLKSNNIYFLQFDRDGNLWAGTDRGVQKIILDKNSQPRIIQHFGTQEGFVGMECNENAAFLAKDGTMWFGTVAGLTKYNPGFDISYQPEIPVHLTDIRLFLEPTDWSKRTDSVRPWYNIPMNLTLPYSDNHLTFEFVGVYHKSPSKVRYRYWLEGNEENWAPLSDKTQAVYSNLPPGDYTFWIKAFKEGVSKSSEPVGFNFSITPPFWQTWWFFLLSAFGMVGGIMAISTIRTRNLKRSQEKLQEEVDLRTRELREEKEKVESANREIIKQKETVEQANRFKSEFLATMSHEIRTPMNGVIGMTELIARTPLSPEQQNFVKNIRLSGETLLALINDILDFSRIESGKLELEERSFNPRECVHEVLQMLSIPAFGKNLELVHHIPENFPNLVKGDVSRLKQVLVNLVGNALKFTHEGYIRVSVDTLPAPDGSKDEVMIRFTVKDTGIGIPQEKLNILFESFTQVDSSTTRKYGGSGLGLAICSRLTELMGGEIWVESKQGEGSEFHFTIKVGVEETAETTESQYEALHGQVIAVHAPGYASHTMLRHYLAIEKVIPQFFTTIEELETLLEGGSIDHVLVEDLTRANEKCPMVEKVVPLSGEIPVTILTNPEKAIQLSACYEEGIRVVLKPMRPSKLFSALMLQETGMDAIRALVQADNKLATSIPLNILIVEDNPINMEVAYGMLKNLGYNPEGVGNGKKAVEAVKNKQYDLIFMDVQMPVMDGLEATRQIRQLEEKQPRIIAMSANAIKGDREKCIEAGMDGYVSKPVVISEIVELIETFKDKEEEGGSDTFVPKKVPVAEAEPQKPKSSPKSNGNGHSHPQANVSDKIDLSVLSEISGGDPTFMSSVIAKIIDKLPPALEEMETHFRNEDFESLRAVAHSTKSSSGYAGSFELQAVLQNIESLATVKDNSGKIGDLLIKSNSLGTQVVHQLKMVMTGLEN